MSNRWGIPKEVEELVKKRDTNCIYCGVEFVSNKTSAKLSSSWERIINDIRLNSSCNASKGTKKLEDWFRSNYCIDKGINRDSVAQVSKDYLEKLLK